MGGGLMQLVAYGAQDIYLTGNPQITFWKVVYRRHTNFARESIEQTLEWFIYISRKMHCNYFKKWRFTYTECYLELSGTVADAVNNPGGANV